MHEATSDISPAPPGFYESLPTKHLSAGVYFHDGDGRVLLVNPVYKEPWEVPGGTVDDDESPLDAARREVREELGLDLEIGRVLCIDYSHAVAGIRGDTIQLVFDGGVLTAEQLASIVLPPGELSEFRFVPLDELDSYVIPAMAKRLRAGAVGASAVYLEGGDPT